MISYKQKPHTTRQSRKKWNGQFEELQIESSCNWCNCLMKCRLLCDCVFVVFFSSHSHSNWLRYLSRWRSFVCDDIILIEMPNFPSLFGRSTRKRYHQSSNVNEIRFNFSLWPRVYLRLKTHIYTNNVHVKLSIDLNRKVFASILL